MIGLIYCAGLGTRLGKLTKNTPKPMIKVGEKPVLERIIDNFNKHGIDKIIVNTHYLHTKIMEYFGDKLLYTFEPILLGEEKTLENLRKWLSGEWVCVANGDTLSNINITAMYNWAKQLNKNVRFVDNGVYAGTMILKPQYYSDRTMSDFNSDSWWIDIGTHNGLQKAKEKFNSMSRLRS